MQIKITVKYHLTPVRVTVIEKVRNLCDKDVEKRESSCEPHVGGNVNWYIQGKQYGNSSKKTKSRTIIWFSYYTFGYLSEENENTNSRR